MRSALLLLLLLSIAMPADAVIYRWVDANGTVNFDDDIARVPEAQRPEMKVFAAKTPPTAAADDARPADGPRQAAFARQIAHGLGLQKSATQDPVSVLQVVGIYPSLGWNPAGRLTPAVVDEVVATTVAAARAHRVRSTAASAEATVLRAAGALGIDTPPPTVAPDPPPPPPAPAEAAPIIVAPYIVVEAAAAPVVVQHPYPGNLVAGSYPGFANGVPYRSTRSFRRSRLASTRSRPAGLRPIRTTVGRFRQSPVQPFSPRPLSRAPHHFGRLGQQALRPFSGHRSSRVPHH